MDELSRLVNTRNTIRFCPECNEKLSYVSIHGMYKCKNCGFTDYDTYGRMKQLLAEHQNLSKADIASALGVPVREISQYIKDGVLENPKSNIN